MTVSTTTNKISYIGNGAATEFAIPFPFLEKEHLKVYQLLNKIQTEREDWTIQNGNLILETAPADGAQIIIMRKVPFTQETDYRENEILAADTLERNFDRLTMQVQQLKEQADRAVTVDIFDETDGADLLPSIRTAVSDAAMYAQIAGEKADNAAEASAIATAQATIATEKANEASDTLADKANVDADNLSAEGKSSIISLMMPDYLNVIELPAIQNNYTFLTDAVMCWSCDSGTALSLTLVRNGQTKEIFVTATYQQADVDSITALFKKGDEITFKNNPHKKYIFPLQGAI